MSVIAVENARHLGALTAPIGDVFQVRRILKYLADVGIGEAVNHVLAFERQIAKIAAISPSKHGRIFLPRKLMTSLAPKHNVL